jgi:hypothetical protein
MRTLTCLALALSLAACDDGGGLHDLDLEQADDAPLVGDALYLVRILYFDVDDEFFGFEPYVAVGNSPTDRCVTRELQHPSDGIARCYPADGGALRGDRGEPSYTGTQLVEGLAFRVWDYDVWSSDELVGEAFVQTTRTGAFEVSDLGDDSDAHRIRYQVLPRPPSVR